MAPHKTGKRAAKAAAGPPAKRQHKDLMLEAMEEALTMAGLPSSCLAMLTAAAPHALTIAAEHRTDAHRMVVGMIDQEVEGVCARLAALHNAEAERLAACVASGEGLEATAREAEASAVAAAEATKERAAAAESAANGVASAEEALRQKHQAQLLHAADFEKSTAEHATFQRALDVDLAAVVEGGPEAQAHFEALQPLLPQLGLPESLESALPATFGKAASERGPFDLAVLEELRQGLRAKCGACAQKVADGEPAAQARQCEVDAAAAAVEEATRAQQQAAQDWDEARSAQAAAEAGARTAREAVTGHGPEVQRLTKARDAAATTLNQFKDYNLTCWHTLRDKKAAAEVPPEAAQAAPAAAGETAAPEAAVLAKAALAMEAGPTDAPVAAAGA